MKRAFLLSLLIPSMALADGLASSGGGTTWGETVPRQVATVSNVYQTQLDTSAGSVTAHALELFAVVPELGAPVYEDHQRRICYGARGAVTQTAGTITSALNKGTSGSPLTTTIADIKPGTVQITDTTLHTGSATVFDAPDVGIGATDHGAFQDTVGGEYFGTINYVTGEITINGLATGFDADTIDVNYQKYSAPPDFSTCTDWADGAGETVTVGGLTPGTIECFKVQSKGVVFPGDIYTSEGDRGPGGSCCIQVQ